MADFEDGPFFDVSATAHLTYVGRLSGVPPLGKRVIVWTADEDTARSIAFRKGYFPAAFTTATFLGTLEDVKNTHRLTSAQIADLHREGFLVLPN